MKTILVVDDSTTLRQSIRRVLSPAGYEILEAVDGLDGLEKLRAHRDLSLVLCDISMPRMTGLEMIAQVQAEGLDTPIIMLTSERHPSVISRAKECGAKAWIVKPFRIELLLEAVNKVTSTHAEAA